MSRMAKDLMLGMAICLTAYLVLTFLLWRVPLLQALLPLVYLAYLTMGGMLIHDSIWRRRFGLALAPFAFMALWFSASVAQRALIHVFADPALADRSLPSGLGDDRSLIVARPGSDHTREITVRAAGPDALVLALIRGSGLQADDLDCCLEGRFILRSDGRDETAATWRHGQRRVLSYLPLLPEPILPAPTSLWDFAAVGPLQRVIIGGPLFSIAQMAEAAYATDWQTLITHPDADAHELLRRAAALRGWRTESDPRRTMDTIRAFQVRGRVDPDMIRIAASLVGTDTPVNDAIHPNIYPFLRDLGPDQKRQFFAALLKRIEDPHEGPSAELATTGIRWFARDDLMPEFGPRAERIFIERSDLRTWQYEIALAIALWTPEPTEALKAARHERLLAAISRDMTPGVMRRALALAPVYRYPTSEQLQVFSEKLDLIPDEFVAHYVSKTLVRRTPKGRASGIRPEFAERVKARIGRITDDELRRRTERQFRFTEN